ncbi:MAG TPA: hypothetical protein VIE65_13950 [Methylobacter sp.]|jgi:hypothetical protein
MARHHWELQPVNPGFRQHTYKTYKCAVCDIKLTVPNLLMIKSGIAKEAKRRGISMDCRKQLVRDVMDD